MTAKRPYQMRISVPNGIPEEAETNMPCPVCKTGMVPATIASAVKALLAAGADGPPPLPSGGLPPTTPPPAVAEDHDEID